MSDITKLTVSETLKALKNKEFSAVELAKAYIKNMEEGRHYNAYITECADKALQQAEMFSALFLFLNSFQLFLLLL